MGTGTGPFFFSLGPFDRARFDALTEGLEVAVVSASEVFADVWRIDSEYFLQRDLAKLAALRASDAVTLGSAAYVTDGIHTSIPFEEGSGIRVISAKHPKEGWFDLAACEEIEAAAHALNPRTALRLGDVVVSTVGTIGNVAVVTKDLLPANTDRHVAILRPLAASERPISSEYLAAVLLSSYGRVQTRRETTGNVQPNLFLFKIRKLLLPRFISAVEEQVAETVIAARHARDAAAAAQREAEGALLGALGLAGWSPPKPLTYTRSADHARTAGRLDAQFHAPAVTELGERLAANFELVSFDKPGEVINGRTVTYAEDGTIPMIRSGDVGKRLERASLLRAKADQPIAYVRNGDVLISSIGFGSIGRVHVVHDDLVTGTVSEVTIIRQTTLEPDYLTAFLKSSYGQMQIERFITGATGQLHLYPRDVRSVFVPLVSEKVQTRFRAFAATQEEWLARSRALLAAATRAVEVAIEEGEAAALAFLINVRKSIDAAAT